MATKQTVDVVGVKTVDDLVSGGPITDLDAFLVMQGVVGSRIASKITGAQLKELIASASVTKIVAGQNITVSEPSATGEVQVSMTSVIPFYETSGIKNSIQLDQE